MSRWSLVSYGGVQSIFNRITSSVPLSNFKVEESSGIDFSLDIRYNFSEKISVGTGLDLNTHSLKLTDSVVDMDIIIEGEWLLTVDSVLIYQVTYDTILSTTKVQGGIKQTSIGIPLYFSYSTPLSSRLSLRTAIGGRLSYETFGVGTQALGFPKSTFSQFGVSTFIRPEIQYRFNNFGVGLYGKFTYDFKHGIDWESIQRQRCGIGGGFVLSYTF